MAGVDVIGFELGIGATVAHPSHSRSSVKLRLMQIEIVKVAFPVTAEWIIAEKTEAECFQFKVITTVSQQDQDAVAVLQRQQFLKLFSTFLVRYVCHSPFSLVQAGGGNIFAYLKTPFTDRDEMPLFQA